MVGCRTGLGTSHTLMPMLLNRHEQKALKDKARKSEERGNPAAPTSPLVRRASQVAGSVSSLGSSAWSSIRRGVSYVVAVLVVLDENRNYCDLAC